MAAITTSAPIASTPNVEDTVTYSQPKPSFNKEFPLKRGFTYPDFPNIKAMLTGNYSEDKTRKIVEQVQSDIGYFNFYLQLYSKHPELHNEPTVLNLTRAIGESQTILNVVQPLFQQRFLYPFGFSSCK